MKSSKRQIDPKAMKPVRVKGDVIEKAATEKTRLSDPAHRFHAAAKHDNRSNVAATGTMQRLRARHNSRAEVVTGEPGSPNVHPVQTQRRRRRS